MARERKGVTNIRTMAGKMDGRKARSSAGALLELSILANERHRLQQEAERIRRRQAEIEARLAEISEKESRLNTYVKTAAVPGDGAARSAPPIPLAEAPARVCTRELTY